MPIKQQSIKSLRQSQKHAKRNLDIREDLKTLIKKIKKAIDAKQPNDQIIAMLKQAQKGLDKAAHKNIIKKNTAARRLSRLIKYNNSGKVAKVEKSAEK
ncbi:MAG: 30S ribosomal protein S20 [Candidatus Parcubacteria bacterium]|nr:30S ribosomal protein S20 [Candidatus Parcubacteria bacterium]